MNATTDRINAANTILHQFTTGTRPDGSTFTTAPDESAARELVRHIHFTIFDGMLPDDWVYDMTHDIVALYAEDDNQYESAYELADDMTNDLLEWASNGIFRAFVDEQLAEYAAATVPANITLDGAIRAGQESALQQMEYAIGEWLNGYADAR